MLIVTMMLIIVPDYTNTVISLCQSCFLRSKQLELFKGDKALPIMTMTLLTFPVYTMSTVISSFQPCFLRGRAELFRGNKAFPSASTVKFLWSCRANQNCARQDVIHCVLQVLAAV